MDDVLRDDECLPLTVLVLAAIIKMITVALIPMVVTTFRVMVMMLMTAKVTMKTGW